MGTWSRYGHPTEPPAKPEWLERAEEEGLDPGPTDEDWQNWREAADYQDEAPDPEPVDLADEPF